VRLRTPFFARTCTRQQRCGMGQGAAVGREILFIQGFSSAENRLKPEKTHN
jgi:hypothetical protein